MCRSRKLIHIELVRGAKSFVNGEEVLEELQPHYGKIRSRKLMDYLTYTVCSKSYPANDNVSRSIAVFLRFGEANLEKQH